MWLRAARHLCTLVLAVLAGGLIGAALVRSSPGFALDARELDPRLNAASRQALAAAHAGERNVLRFYLGYLAGLPRGELGLSHFFRRPVRDLLRERAGVTFRSVAAALAGGWAAGFLLALAAVMARRRAADALCSLASACLLCLPSAVVALAFLHAGGAPAAAIAVVVAPRVFRFSRNLLEEAAARPHVLTARAKGLGGVRLLLWHVLPTAGPELLALAGVTVNLALGAAIPIEVICDSPGLGQLAWQAALNRDLPLLVNLTLVITVVTMLANTASDLASYAFGARP